MLKKPAHKVAVDGFFMDMAEVTNLQFRQFVEETGYMTVAERELDWEEIKNQMPPGTPRPPDSLLQPGSLIFRNSAEKIRNLNDFTQWWVWKVGTHWKQPQGPNSTIEGLDDHPVVHIAFEDAIAYCEWAGKRLPTEAEMEFAARVNQATKAFTWGSSEELRTKNSNTWEGEFPNHNTAADGFKNKAPVGSYPPNAYGLYDMAGNVWEWTRDWSYRILPGKI